MARRSAVFAGMVLVLALLVWAGVHNLRARREAMQNHNAVLEVHPGPVGSTGASADEGGDAMVAVDMKGKPAPAFTLSTVDGKKVSLADFKGKPVVVNFWATYCGPCKLEMPWFEEFRQKYAAQGLTILGVDNEDGVGKDEILRAAKKTGVTYPILLSTTSDRITKDYGLADLLPVTYYIDRNGKILAQVPGARSKDETESRVKEIVGG